MPELYPKQNITPEEIAVCRRVADYMRRIAKPHLSDIFDDSPETNAKRKSKDKPFVEFFIIFFPVLIEKFDNRMRWAIRAFARKQIEVEQLKAVADEYIKAHTVVWLNGAPLWKIDEIG